MNGRSPAVILYDANGDPLAVQDGVAIPANTPGLMVVGTDGGTARYVRVASDGTVRMDPTGTTAQPVTDNGGSLTTDTPQLPASLVGGRLTIDVGSWFGAVSPTVGQKAMAASVPVTFANDQTALDVSVTAPNIPLEDFFRENVANGANENMVVDGSGGGGIEFDVNADPTEDILVNELRIVITTDDTNLDGASFFEKGALSNGCLLEIVSEGVTTELANFQITEDFLQLPSLQVFNTIDFTGQNDIFSVSYPLPNAKLEAGTADEVRMTIRDTLDDDHIKYTFTMTVFGRKQTP